MLRLRPFAGPFCGLLAAVAFWAFDAAAAAEPPFEVFAVSDAVRIFEDGYACPEAKPAEIRVSGLRNETLSAQFVIRAIEDLQEAAVAIGPLKAVQGLATIPAENVQWNFVQGIAIEKNTPKLLASDLIRPAPARFPDCLSDDRQCPVGKGSLKAVYLTIRIPGQAEPGEYVADVTVRAGSAGRRLPLILKVYPLALSPERHVMVTEWFSTGPFRRHHGVDPSDQDRFFKMLRVYAENMAEHRQNVFQVSLGLVRTSRAADGKLRSDFSDFDRWAQVFWDTGRMDRLETGFVAHFGEGGWSSREILLNDFSVHEEDTGRSRRVPGKEFLPHLLPAVVEHLRAKKWLDKTVFHICDEPSNHNVMAWREASEFVYRCAPELRRIDAIETTHCLDRLEIWVPKLNHLSTWQAAYEDAQRRGNELWFYTVGIFQSGSLPNKTVDVPLIQSRLMHWLNYRYGLQGYLHWGFNSWTDDPINAPGEHRGDGWHVYPKPGGLLNSLRWEQMRNGLQDYEVLWLLEDKTRRIKAALSPRVAELIEPSRRGVEIASQVVRSYSDCELNPDVLYAARRQVIEEILDLDRRPCVLLQTNPVEFATVANDCAVDVYGWAEPRMGIKINGRPTPVLPDGLFLEQVRPSPEGTITVEAADTKGSKTLARKFRLQYPSPQSGKR